MASASIEEAPVKAKATNLATAIPRLAKKAARIALVPPPAAMGGKANGVSCGGPRSVRDLSARQQLGAGTGCVADSFTAI